MKTLIRFSTVKYHFYFTRLPRVNLFMYGIKLYIAQEKIADYIKYRKQFR